MNHLARGQSGLRLILGLLLCLGPMDAGAQLFKKQKVKKPEELLTRQEPPSFYQDNFAKLNPANASIVVSLSRQRVYIMAAGEVAIDSPISSGKRVGQTPTGDFTIVEKDRDHRSSIYGNFVDRRGRVVRSGVSTKIDSAPSGTRFSGAPMKYFMRITWQGVGLHVGILPGYPASHGCIRLPEPVAEAVYYRVKLGTPVRVVN
jgi:lipoprotein-anchoring transpeptidase ErfK/SrfK